MDNIIHIVIGQKTRRATKEGDCFHDGIFYQSKDIAGCFFDKDDALNFIESMRIPPNKNIGCSGLYPFKKGFNKMYVLSGPIQGENKTIVDVEKK